VVAPLIGPFIDRMRGGQRMVVVLVGVLRAGVLVGMAFSLDSLTLFPLAFAALILSKTYAIAKSALVPVTVPDEEALVGANGRLGQVAGLTGFAVAVPAALLQLVATSAALVLGALLFLAASANARRLPRSIIATGPADRRENEELHSARVVRAANAMRVLRGTVGFMFFHLAFWLRSEIAGTAWFGLAVGLSSLATLGANVAGPRLRQRVPVETMLLAALVAVGAAGAAAAVWDRVVGGILLAATVNAAATIGRLAFESTVQSGAPDANRGRAFSRFETQNQMAWVLGGVVPVLVSPTGRIGFALAGIAGVLGAVAFARAGRTPSVSRARRDAPATDREPRSRPASEDRRGRSRSEAGGAHRRVRRHRR
ncbi:MAG: hypothetical protein RL330_59, partial [Actinomycetota bacterium]